MATNKIFSYEVTGDGTPMDLTREEFARFQSLLSSISGPMRTRNVSLIFSLLLGAGVLVPELILWRQGQQPDVLLLAAMLLLVGMSLVLWGITPPYITKKAEKLYDLTTEAGQSFYGLVRIYPDRVEKAKPDYTVVIPFNEQALFIEDAGMLVFLNKQRQAIVLPARCLTPAQADILRAGAELLPPANRRFVSRLVPQGQAALLPPPTEGELLYEDTIRYTPEEYVVVAKDQTQRLFWRRVPLFCIISMMLALTFGWNDQSMWQCVALFALSGGVLTFFNLVLPLRRVTLMAPHMRGEQLSVRVTVDYRGLRLLKENQGEGSMPWSAIKHVYDADTFVRFSGKQEFFLPKRCIPDLDTFSADIDRYMHK